METKSLFYGLIGFFIGGLLVSVAATTFDKPQPSTDSVNNSAMTMHDMTNDLQQKSGDAFDEAFIGYMIEHHQSAVDMAELAEARAKHPEIKQLSAEIIAAQQQEIESMRDWRRDWGYQEVTEVHGAAH